MRQKRKVAGMMQAHPWLFRFVLLLLIAVAGSVGALVLRQLPPWHANLAKRQVRSPKVFVEDSGLLHTLLGIETGENLAGHPKVGASWEGFLIKEIIERLNARTEECFFWATHTGAELDLLIVSGQRRLGFEVKRTTAPRLTRSMASVLEALDLEAPLPDLWPLFEAMKQFPVLAIRGGHSDLLTAKTLQMMLERHPHLTAVTVPFSAIRTRVMAPSSRTSRTCVVSRAVVHSNSTRAWYAGEGCVMSTSIVPSCCVHDTSQRGAPVRPNHSSKARRVLPPSSRSRSARNALQSTRPCARRARIRASAWRNRSGPTVCAIAYQARAPLLRASR